MAPDALPEHPDLAQLRRRAKELRDAARAGDPAAAKRIRRHVRLRPGAAVTLSAAQLTLAREHGFASWPRLKAEVEARTMGTAARVTAFLTGSIEGPDAQAVRLLAADPGLATVDIAAAAVLGEADRVRALVAADPAAAVTPDRRRGWPPLLYVCHSRWHRIDPARAGGILEVARLLLDAGARPNTQLGVPGTGYASALYGAAGIADNPPLTRLLLDRGADPDDGESLYHAAGHRDSACLRLLVEAGAPAAGTNALAAAVGHGNVDAVRLLIHAGADPGRSHPGRPAPTGLLPDLTINPLPAAAATDTPAVVEALLAAGADPNLPGRNGLSPLRIAVRRGKRDIAGLLARYGAVNDTTAVDHLLGACMRADRGAAARLLADHPALLGQLSADDQAVLVDAADHLGTAPAALMLDLGFPIDVHRGEDGATALHAAAYSGRAELVRLLLARGADPDRADLQWGATALAWATVGSGERPRYSPAGDWVATVTTLLDAGASRQGAWVAGKPPGEDVAALLARYGVGEPDEPPPPRPAGQTDDHRDTDLSVARQVAERLRAAFDAADLDLLASVLHPDVRWGGGPAGCHNRAHVLEWYAALHAQGVTSQVTEMTVHGDAVALGLTITRRTDQPGADQPTQTYQVFRLADAAVIQIHDHPNRHDALASLTTSAPG